MIRLRDFLDCCTTNSESTVTSRDINENQQRRRHPTAAGSISARNQHDSNRSISIDLFPHGAVTQLLLPTDDETGESIVPPPTGASVIFGRGVRQLGDNHHHNHNNLGGVREGQKHAASKETSSCCDFWMSPWEILQQISRMYLTKRDELFLLLGLRHEDPFLESQFQLYYYNSQRIVSVVCCICAFVFCGGGTIIWSETINVLFVLWDAFAVLVWAMCACILFWLYRRHLQLLRELERCASIVEDDDDIMLDSNDTTLASSRGTTFRLSILGNRSQSPQHTASITTKQQSAARFARNATASASSSGRVQRLEEELQWNTTWHERFLMVANGASVWFTVGLNGAQGSCDYVPVDRRILDCRNAINTESLLILFISASVFLMQVRMFIAWPLFSFGREL